MTTHRLILSVTSKGGHRYLTLILRGSAVRLEEVGYDLLALAHVLPGVRVH